MESLQSCCPAVLFVHEAEVQAADLRRINDRPSLWISTEQSFIAKKRRGALQ
jgi:hypothetical protein